MRLVLAGGTGYIGRALTAALVGGGHQVVLLTRRQPEDVRGLPSGAGAATWRPREAPGTWAGALEGTDAIVNLAGANIGTRPWTRRRMAEIMDSRVQATSALVAATAALPPSARPGALVTASGVDYYGDRGDERLDEGSGPGESFLASVCIRSEAAAREAEPLGVRTVLVRAGIVLSPDSLTLRLLALPFRLFAGGPLGRGRQWFSWVHLEDAVGLYRLAVEDATVSGPMNAVAPDPRRNEELARELGRVLHRPCWLPAPAPLLRLAMRHQAELVFHSHRVEPAVALAHGYQYRYPTLRGALEASLG